jgi:hypothetical protein
MRWLIFVLFISCKCTAQKKTAPNDSFTLYPYYIFRDTFSIPSGEELVPIRICSNSEHVQKVIFDDLIGLKFSEYKRFSFSRFDSAIVKRIFARECFDTPASKGIYTLTVSRAEYNSISPEIAYQKYFPNGEFHWDADTLPPREFWLALLVLFDNKYTLRINGAGQLYVATKAWTDDKLKELYR